MNTNNRYKATQMWNELLLTFRQNLPRGRHRRYMRVYEDCFVASFALSWLHQHLRNNPNYGPSVTRHQTLLLLQKFHKADVFKDVRGEAGQEFADNGQLYRFIEAKVSPVKRLASGRVPLGNLPLNQNTQQTTPVRGSKNSPHKPITPQDIMKSTSHVKRSEDKKKGLSQSVSEKSMVAGPAPPPVLYCGSPRPSASTGLLTAHEVEHAWRSTTLDRLQELLELKSLESIVDLSTVHTHHIIHNITQVNKNGIVSNIEKKDRLPDWVLNAMKCLAYWPDKLEGYTYYEGLENDVFRIVREYFDALEEPLTTFTLYDMIIRTMVRAENLSGGNLPRRSATCASPRHTSAEMDFPAQPPPPLTSFASVENLMMNLTMNATGTAQQTATQKNNTITRCLSSGSLHRAPFSKGLPQQRHTSSSIDKLNSPASRCNGYSIVFTKPNLSLDDACNTTMSLDRQHARRQLLSSAGGGSQTQSLKRSTTNSRTAMNDTQSDCGGDYKYGYTVVLAATTPKRKAITDSSTARPSSAPNTGRRVVQNDPCHYDGKDSSVSSSSNSSKKTPPPYIPPPSYTSSVSPHKNSSSDVDSDTSYSSVTRRSNGYSAHVFGPGYVPNPDVQCALNLSQRKGSVTDLQCSYRKAVASSYSDSTPVGKTLFARCRVASVSALDDKNEEEARENRVSGALSICLLLLPPASRRKLHLLLRLMKKMLDNTRLHLADSPNMKVFLVQTLTRSILRPAEEADYDEVLSRHTVSYMVEHYQKLLSPPEDIRNEIEKVILQLRREKVSVEQFEAQKLTTSQLALVELLEGIVNNKDMVEKEKKRRLKQFNKTYPEIYKKRFPTSQSEQELFPSKQPKIKPPLLTRPLFRLRNLRI